MPAFDRLSEFVHGESGAWYVPNGVGSQMSTECRMTDDARERQCHIVGSVKRNLPPLDFRQLLQVPLR